VRYLDLNIVTAEHLSGTWEVLERLGGQASEVSPLSACNRISFLGKGKLQVENSKMETGTWEFFKETEIIYNPQLNFGFKNQPEVINAIITRFREDEEEEELSLKVTLYFTSGLELVLEQKKAKPA
jgi:hypothetical protein